MKISKEDCKINHEIMWGEIVNRIVEHKEDLYKLKESILKDKNLKFTVDTNKLFNLCFLCECYVDLTEEDYCNKCPLNTNTGIDSGCVHYRELICTTDPQTKLELATYIRDILK